MSTSSFACDIRFALRISFFDPVPQGPGEIAQRVALARRQGVDALARGFRDFPEAQAAEYLGFHHPALGGRQGPQGVVQRLQEAVPDEGVLRVQADRRR